MHGKHALDLGTQPVDRIEETMGSRILRVHRLLPAPGEAAAEVPHVVIDAGAGGYMSEKSILRIACPCQPPASESEKVRPQFAHAHLWRPCSFPNFFRRFPWQYGHSPKKVLDLLRRSKTWSLKHIWMVLSGSSGAAHRGKLLYHPVAGLGTPMI